MMLLQTIGTLNWFISLPKKKKKAADVFVVIPLNSKNV